jgi:transposase
MSKKNQTKNRFSPEIRDRAIRMVMEQESKHNSQWAAIESISEKIGCSPQTLHSWIKKREVANSDPASLSFAEREQLKELQRENKELKNANEILRKASAFFAQAELDRRPK